MCEVGTETQIQTLIPSGDSFATRSRGFHSEMVSIHSPISIRFLNDFIIGRRTVIKKERPIKEKRSLRSLT